VGALEVVNLDLDAARAGVLEPAHQLDADRAAVLLEPQGADEPGAHEAKVAVDVADRQPEQKPHRGRIDGADDAAVQRVGAIALVALDPVDVRDGVLGETHQLGRVVLVIAVGVEDPLSPSLGERRAQRASIASVDGVLDDPQARLPRGDLGEPLHRVVARPVVDDDYLPVGSELV